MALLENLLPGNVYLIKISASNEVGEGPFSNTVELDVQPKEMVHSSMKSKHFNSANSQGQFANKQNETVSLFTRKQQFFQTCFCFCLAIVCTAETNDSIQSKSIQAYQ